MSRFPQCSDCAFEHVEPAICDECLEADQFVESESDDPEREMPLYYRPWSRQQ